MERPIEIHTDSELLEGLYKSRKDAFREIYVRYWKEIFLVAYRKVRQKGLAEELAQNLFISLWERRSESRYKEFAVLFIFLLKV